MCCRVEDERSLKRKKTVNRRPGAVTIDEQPIAPFRRRRPSLTDRIKSVVVVIPRQKRQGDKDGRKKQVTFRDSVSINEYTPATSIASAATLSNELEDHDTDEAVQLNYDAANDDVLVFNEASGKWLYKGEAIEEDNTPTPPLSPVIGREAWRNSINEWRSSLIQADPIEMYPLSGYERRDINANRRNGTVGLRQMDDGIGLGESAFDKDIKNTKATIERRASNRFSILKPEKPPQTNAASNYTFASSKDTKVLATNRTSVTADLLVSNLPPVTSDQITMISAKELTDLKRQPSLNQQGTSSSVQARVVPRPPKSIARQSALSINTNISNNVSSNSIPTNNASNKISSNTNPLSTTTQSHLVPPSRSSSANLSEDDIYEITPTRATPVYKLPKRTSSIPNRPSSVAENGFKPANGDLAIKRTITVRHSASGIEKRAQHTNASAAPSPLTTHEELIEFSWLKDVLKNL